MADFETIDLFANMVKESFNNFTSLDMSKYDVEVKDIVKTNETLKGLSLTKKVPDTSITPQLYLNRFYEEMKQGREFNSVMKQIVSLYEQAMGDVPDVPMPDLTDTSKVFMQVINKEMNTELLAKAVHRDILDLAVVYRLLVDVDASGIQSVLVTDDILELLNVNEEELYELAKANTRELLGVVKTPLDDYLFGLSIDSNMLMVTNDYFAFGAANILYTDVLKEIADELDDDLEIIPSSIHELLIVRSSKCEQSMIKGMIGEVNAEHVERKDVLSNNLYHYDRERDRVTIVIEEEEEE